MELRAKLQSVHFDYATRKQLVTFLLEDDISGYEGLKEKLLDIVLKIHKEKRSLDENAYFHKLNDLLASANNVSRHWMKNRLISDYGQKMYLPDGRDYIFSSIVPPSQMLNEEVIHVSLVGIEYDPKTREDIYVYQRYRETKTYDVYEMYQLIQGAIGECKASEIPYATPKEIEHMKMLERKMNERSS